MDNLITELDKMLIECGQKNWDGYNAQPINLFSINQAKELLKMLSLDYQPDSATPECDGGVNLEWYKSPKRLLSISLNGENEISYAGIFDDDSYIGRVVFSAENIPLDLIKKVKGE